MWTKNGGRHELTAGVYVELTDGFGRVWFGYGDNKIAVLDGDRVQAFGPKEGLQVGDVTAIYCRDARIWIGGDLGLQRFNGGRFYTINPIDRDWFRGITGIVETTNGDLWLNGLGGVVHLRRAEIAKGLADPAYRIGGERFGRAEGLPGLPSQVRYMPTAHEGTDGCGSTY